MWRGAHHARRSDARAHPRGAPRIRARAVAAVLPPDRRARGRPARPAAAPAQGGAGDQQYQDPFGGGSRQRQAEAASSTPVRPAARTRPAPSQQPAAPQTAAQAPAPRRGRALARPRRRRTLPRTGVDARVRGRGRRGAPARRRRPAPPRRRPWPRLRRGRAAETEAPAPRGSPRACAPATSCSSQGEMGAGKTTFVRGAARALGVDGPGDEPDVHASAAATRRPRAGRAPRPAPPRRPRRRGPGAARRLRSTPRRVAFVEWPEVAEPRAGEARAAARVRLEHAGGDRRARRGHRDVILGARHRDAGDGRGRRCPTTASRSSGATTRRRASGPATPRSCSRWPPRRSRGGRRLGRRRPDRRRRRARARSPGCASASRPPARWRRRAGAEVGRRSPRCEALAAAARHRARRPRRPRRPPRRGVRRGLRTTASALLAPVAVAPRGRSPRSPSRAHAPWLAVGDGAVRFRDRLEAAGRGPGGRLAAARCERRGRVPARAGGPPRRPRRAPPGVRPAPDAHAVPRLSDASRRSTSAASPTPTSRRSSRSSAARSRRRGRWRCSCSSCPSPAASAWPPRRDGDTRRLPASARATTRSGTS